MRSVRSGKGLQAEERDDSPRFGPSIPWLYLSFLSGAGTQVSTTGQSAEVGDYPNAQGDGSRLTRDTDMSV